MTPLCDTTARIIEKLFAAAERDEARELLEVGCGTNLPLMGKGGDRDELLRRIRLAALKIGNGNLDRMKEAVRLAQIDWRDLLMEAGFGSDIFAHQYWAIRMFPPKKTLR
jgi:hypothetical protein